MTVELLCQLRLRALHLMAMSATWSRPLVFLWPAWRVVLRRCLARVGSRRMRMPTERHTVRCGRARMCARLGGPCNATVFDSERRQALIACGPLHCAALCYGGTKTSAWSPRNRPRVLTSGPARSVTEVFPSSRENVEIPRRAQYTVGVCRTSLNTCEWDETLFRLESHWEYLVDLLRGLGKVPENNSRFWCNLSTNRLNFGTTSNAMAGSHAEGHSARSPLRFATVVMCCGGCVRRISCRRICHDTLSYSA